MALSLTTPRTLLGAVAPKADGRRLAFNIAATLFGTLLLTLSARINVPGLPVPTTFQTMAVALIAAAFGWRVGVATTLLYLVQGLAGLPVFASGGGLGYLAVPSFGFIVGFVPMAYIIGRAADAGASRSILPLFIAMLVGDAVLFAFGFAWLAAMIGAFAAPELLGSAFAKAVQPFLVWDALKMAFAAVTVVGAWQLVRPRA